MSGILWDKIAGYVHTGMETAKIELKEKVDSTGVELAKDISAIANTKGGSGCLVLGVVDQRHRISDNPNEYIPGFNPPSVEVFQQQVTQTLTKFLEPVPEAIYSQIQHPIIRRPIGVIEIPASARRPHALVRSSREVEQWQIWVRRGSDSYLASRDEIIEMCGDYWNEQLAREHASLQRFYTNIQRDATDWMYIAQQLCQRLYHSLSRNRREKVIRRILAFFEKESYYHRWIGESTLEEGPDESKEG